MTRTLVLAARVSSVVLLGGIALASIAIPFWSAFEERAAEAALRKLGASLSDAKSGGLLVELPTPVVFVNASLVGPPLPPLFVLSWSCSRQG